MKLFTLSISALLISLCAAGASARDDIADYSIADALASEQAKNILGSEITFYFGDQPHGAVTKISAKAALAEKPTAPIKATRKPASGYSCPS